MGFTTTPKDANPIQIPVNGYWHEFKTTFVPGSPGEPVASGYYVNLYGHLEKGATTGIIDIRGLRDGGTDETGLDTIPILGDTFDTKLGLWKFRWYVTDFGLWARNMSRMEWQIKPRRRIQTLWIKEGFYAKGTDFD